MTSFNDTTQLERQLSSLFRAEAEQLHLPSGTWQAIRPQMGEPDKQSLILGFKRAFHLPVRWRNPMKVRYAAPAATILLAAIAAVLFILLVNDDDEGPAPAATPTPELQTPTPSDVTPTLRPTFTPLPATATPTPEPPIPTVAPTQPTGTATAAPQPTATTVPLPTPTSGSEPEGLSGEWEVVSPMTVPRYSFAVVTLQDGRVLAIGGQGEDGPGVMEAELFDPATNIWTSAGQTVLPRDSSLAATLLTDGRVLVVGGAGLGLADTEAAEVYDPSTNQWTEIASMNIARSMPGIITLDDGRVLVAGGVFTDPSLNTNGSTFSVYVGQGVQVNEDFHESTSEIYDPTTDEWTLVGEMPESRLAHYGLAKLPDGRVILAGGDRDPATDTAWIFDPGTERWESTESLPIKTGATAAVLMDDGRVMAAGGRAPTFSPAGSTTTQIFDPATSSWTLGTEFSEPRCGAVAYNMPEDARILLSWRDFTGLCTASVATARSVEIFDPEIDAWSRYPLPMAFRDLGTAMLADGRLLVTGGRQLAAQVWNTEASWIFTPPPLN